jgi:hypothetical protein
LELQWKRLTNSQKDIKLTAGGLSPMEVSVNELKIEILPEVAKRELASFYEYLVFKYLKGMETTKKANNGRNKNLAAFSEFKKLRDRINPKVDKSIDIDTLINEVNNDIF